MPFVYSLPLIILTGLLFWFRPIIDPDLGWHLFGGATIVDQIAAQGLSASTIVPQGDPLNSFSNFWHDYHWLSQLLLYGVYLVGSYPALQWLLVVCSCLILITLGHTIVYLISKGRAGGSTQGTLVALALILLPTWQFLFTVASVRPQFIAILLLAIAQLLLLKRSKLELPILFLLAAATVNMHVYWVFIPFLWLCYRIVPRGLGDHSYSSLYVWGGAFLLGAAGLVSPYGIFAPNLSLASALDNYALIWDYLFAQDSILKSIAEFRPLFSTGGTTPVLFVIVAIFVARFISVRAIKMHPAKFVAFAVSAYLGFSSIKYLGIFAVLAIPFLCEIYNNSTVEPSRFGKFLNRYALQVNLSVFAIVFYVALQMPAAKAPQSEQMEEMLPLRSCGKIPSLGLSPTGGRDHVRVLTHFNDGGWCRWAIYLADPKYPAQVTTDGRTQGVPVKQISDAIDTMYGNREWKMTLAKWRPDLFLIPKTLPVYLFYSNIGEEYYTPIADEGQFVLYQPNWG